MDNGNPRRRGRPPATDGFPGLFQPIAKPRLSQEIRRQLLGLIADGRLPAATQVHEATLARQLGVSRTPLHEAMASLERDGLLESLGRRGWRIAGLREADARELYPVLASLEALAINLSNSLLLGAVDELRALSDQLAQPRATAGETLALENHWHSLLLAQCPNRTLVEMVRPLVVLAFRFELAASRANWPRPAGEIPSVGEGLLRGDYRAAARFIEIHWRDRGESMTAWVRERGGPPGSERETPEPEPMPGAA
jgi:DNA-binding GntR family transcriptional regulator